MNQEELKLILDTVQSVAQTAGVAGVIWIVLHYAAIMIMHLAWPLCFCIAFVAGAKQMRRYIDASSGIEFINKNVKAEFLGQLERLIGEREGKYIFSSDIEKLRKAIDQMKKDGV